MPWDQIAIFAISIGNVCDLARGSGKNKNKSRVSVRGRGRVKRALLLSKMSSSQKGAVYFLSLNEIAVGASKCAVPFPIK
jgi:hypothetical protein